MTVTPQESRLDGGGGITLQAVTEAKDQGVGTLSIAYQQMAQRRHLIDDLFGGTLVMRSKRSQWLPKEEGESDQSYNARLQRTVLFGALEDTVTKIVSKPYSRPVTWEEEERLPERLRGILSDADREGSDITEWSRAVFKDAVKYGMTHALVDFPQVNGVMNLAEERGEDIRPYFVHVSPGNVLGFKWTRQKNGRPKLTQVRIAESRVEEDGEYGEKTVKYVRVINAPGTSEDQALGTWELWREDEDKKGQDSYVLHESGTHTHPDIPFVTLYLNRTGFMQAEPPFEQLAYLNLLHWQSNSDQVNLTHYARVPILTRLGFTAKELKEKLAIGAGKGIGSTNADAKVAYVEHSGAAIKSGMEALRHIEEMMEVLGLQPFIANLGDQTATARGIDEGKTQSLVQSWIRAMENFLLELMVTAAQWIGIDDLRDSGFAFNIFNEFGITLRAAEDIEALMKMRTSVPPQIDHETFLLEVRRRGVLSDSNDVQSIMDRVAAESAPPPNEKDPDFQVDDDPEENDDDDDDPEENDDE